MIAWVLLFESTETDLWDVMGVFSERENAKTEAALSVVNVPIKWTDFTEHSVGITPTFMFVVECYEIS